MVKQAILVDQSDGLALDRNFAGETERLCLTSRFDIPRQNACASYQN